MPLKPKQTLSFDLSKRNAQSKLDKSPKGSIDAPILAFVLRLNSHPDYVTTSTCSGRIALFASAPGRGGRWLLVEHRTVSLDEVATAIGASDDRPSLEGEASLYSDATVEDAAAAAAAGGLIVALKAEPAILHVQCRDEAAGRRLLAVALRAGFRESGLVLSNASAKVMLAIRTTSNGLETPVAVASARNGGRAAATVDEGEASGAAAVSSDASTDDWVRPLVPQAYLAFLVAHANEKFEANVARTAILEAAFSAMVAEQEAADAGDGECVPCEPDVERAQARGRRGGGAGGGGKTRPAGSRRGERLGVRLTLEVV